MNDIPTEEELETARGVLERLLAAIQEHEPAATNSASVIDQALFEIPTSPNDWPGA